MQNLERYCVGVAGNRNRKLYIKVGLSGTIETVEYQVREIGHGGLECRLAGTGWADLASHCQLKQGHFVVFVATEEPHVYQMGLNRFDDE